MFKLVTRAVFIGCFSLACISPLTARACDAPPPPGVPVYDPYAQLEAEREAAWQDWAYQDWLRARQWRQWRWEHEKRRGRGWGWGRHHDDD